MPAPVVVRQVLLDLVPHPGRPPRWWRGLDSNQACQVACVAQGGGPFSRRDVAAATGPDKGDRQVREVGSTLGHDLQVRTLRRRLRAHQRQPAVLLPCVPRAFQAQAARARSTARQHHVEPRHVPTAGDPGPGRSRRGAVCHAPARAVRVQLSPATRRHRASSSRPHCRLGEHGSHACRPTRQASIVRRGGLEPTISSRREAPGVLGQFVRPSVKGPGRRNRTTDLLAWFRCQVLYQLSYPRVARPLGIEPR